MLILNRLNSDLLGTYGVFLVNKKPVCHSYELPWHNNARNISCIPDGSYRVIKATSPRFGRCFYIKDVPGRSGILIHPGNTRRDTEGCILPGLDVDAAGVLHSRLAMDRLYDLLTDDFTLTIRKVY